MAKEAVANLDLAVSGGSDGATAAAGWLGAGIEQSDEDAADLQAVSVVMYGAGLRVSEACALQFRDIDGR